MTAAIGLLDRPKGGSINDISFDTDHVVKSYDGTIPRGFEKLRAEYFWLASLPDGLAGHFARPVRYLETVAPDRVELHLRREAKVAVSKAILRGEMRPDQLFTTIDRALEFLTERLYPLRSGPMEGIDVYGKYHGERIDLALQYLPKLPWAERILTAKRLVVNGQECPPLLPFLDWLTREGPSMITLGRMVAMHGDAHLDNILTDTGTDDPDVLFIDPRGDFLGPAHYDFGKLLKALEGYYDEIHYGMSSLSHDSVDGGCTISLSVNATFDAHYAAGLRAAARRLPQFAAAEQVSPSDFLRSSLVAECVHVLSFSFYHAYGPDPDIDRVVSFLAVFALLAKRLSETRGEDATLTERRLLAA